MVSRKKFLATLLLGGAAAQLPWLISCSTEKQELPSDIRPLAESAFRSLRDLLMVLFPKDDFGPSALEINADTYILWVLNDPELDPAENQYIIEKLERLMDVSQKSEGDEFHKLSRATQEDIVAEIAAESWGKRLFSRLLTLTFEALLINPAYHVNPNEVGWKWLSHNPGQPRASVQLMYPQILDRKNEL